MQVRLRGTDVAGISGHFTVYVNESRVGASMAGPVDTDYRFEVPGPAEAIERIFIGYDNEAIDRSRSPVADRNLIVSTVSIDGAAVAPSQFVIHPLDGTSLQKDGTILVSHRGLQIVRTCRPGMTRGTEGCYPSALDDDFLGSLAAHPRLMLTDARLRTLQEAYSARTDPSLSRYVDAVLRQVDAREGAAPPVYAPGVILLGVTQNAQWDTYLESFGYRWFKRSDPVRAARYSAAAKRIMTALAGFPDWHPAHFLDTAEATHAMAIGLDWLYDDLSPEERATFANAIADKSLTLLKSHLEQPSTAPSWCFYLTNNWRGICHGGLAIGALAIAESHPDLARTILRGTVIRLTRPPHCFAPNGASREGPSYGDYTAYYEGMVATAFETALGHDFTLKQSPGLSQAGDFILDLTGADRRLFNFGDTWGAYRTRLFPTMMFLGTYDTAYSDSEHELLASTSKTVGVHHLIWYRPPSLRTVDRPLSRTFDGIQEVFVARSSWRDPDALFMAFKAGVNNSEHAHIDAGTFVIDALGQRWAMDLGPETYGSVCPDEGCFRTISKGHNVPLLGGQGQIRFGHGEMLRTRSDVPSPFAIADLTRAYAQPTLSSYQRGLRMLEGRSLLLQDEFVFTAPQELNWGMLTEASIAIPSPNRAVLTLNGRTLAMEILAPQNARFVAESAVQPPPQTPNTGISRLMILFAADVGPTSLSIHFKPAWSAGGPILTPPLTPLAGW